MCLSIKITSYQIKMILWSYLYDGNPYIWKEHIFIEIGPGFNLLEANQPLYSSCLGMRITLGKSEATGQKVQATVCGAARLYVYFLFLLFIKH